MAQHQRSSQCEQQEEKLKATNMNNISEKEAEKKRSGMVTGWIFGGKVKCFLKSIQIFT